MFRRRAVFLDRDGTLTKAVYRPSFAKKTTCPYTLHELEFVPDADEVLAELKQRRFLRIMATNQPDVALGYMYEHVWVAIQRLAELTLNLDQIKMCRHTTEQNCNRKKPLPGMLFDARDDLGIDLAESFMIGDTDADIGAGKAAGCTTILITSGKHNVINWKEDYPKPFLKPDYQVDKLADILKIVR